MEIALKTIKKLLGDQDLYFEVSALTGEGITEMFNSIFSEAYCYHYLEPMIGNREENIHQRGMSFNLLPGGHGAQRQGNNHQMKRCNC